MNSKILIDAIGKIDDDIIEQAASQQKKSSRRKGIKLLLSAAAVFTVTLLCITVFSESYGLPELYLPEEIIDGTGTGEIYNATDISELINSNPYNETMKIKALPIYKNTLSYNNDGTFEGTNKAEMLSRLYTFAERFNESPNKTEIQDSGDSLSIQTSVANICVTAVLNVIINLNTPYILPEELKFSPDSDALKLYQTSEYIIKEYKSLIGAENITININGGEIDIDGNRIYTVELFEDSENDENKIINYNFNTITLNFNENGDFTGFVFHLPDLSKKEGDYPIIDEHEAENQLRKGNYLTTLTHKISNSDKIVKTELIYRTDSTAEYFMPYYKVFIMLPCDNNKNELNSYGVYYVPAVKMLTK